jgi:hypothetical protein
MITRRQSAWRSRFGGACQEKRLGTASPSTWRAMLASMQGEPAVSRYVSSRYTAHRNMPALALVPLLAGVLLTLPIGAFADTVRHLRWGYTVTSRNAGLIPHAELLVRIPLAVTPWQRCTNFTATCPFETVREQDGGQVLRFAFTNLPPYAVRTLWIDLDVSLSDKTDALAPAAGAWLGPDGIFDYQDQAMGREVDRLRPGASDGVTRRFTLAVADHVQKIAYSGENRGALYAFREKRGDCSEQMALFVAYCRRAGIPARGVGGVATSRDRVVRGSDYHNWAVFFAEGKWGVADPSARFCSPNGVDYVAYEWIDGPPAQEGYVRRYRLVGEGVTVTME